MTIRQRLLLMSVGKRALLEKVKDELFGGAPEKLKCICIPTAAYAEDNHDWLYEELDEFRAFGLTLDMFDIKGQSVNAVRTRLKDADVIYFTGGNTYVLLEHMKKCDFAAILREKLDDGLLYIGTSAGAVVTSPDISFIEDMDDPSAATLDDTKALGLVDFQIMPHIDSDYFKDAIQAIIPKLSNDIKTIGLRDDQALFINGPYMEIL